MAVETTDPEGSDYGKHIRHRGNMEKPALKGRATRHITARRGRLKKTALCFTLNGKKRTIF